MQTWIARASVPYPEQASCSTHYRAGVEARGGIGYRSAESGGQPQTPTQSPWQFLGRTKACSRHRGARFLCGRRRTVLLPGAAEARR